jgi:hypothetical protein
MTTEVGSEINMYVPIIFPPQSMVISIGSSHFLAFLWFALPVE